MQGGAEDIEFLARSQTRVHMVKALRQEGELGRDELRDRVDASRTTVQRNLEALEDRGWVRNTNRKYSLATCGEMIADDFLDLVGTVSMAEQLYPVLQWVDRSKFDLDLRLLEDADVVTAEPGNPWAMVNHHVRRLEQMDSGRLLLPLTGLNAMQVAHDRVVNHEAEVELIMSSDVLETFRTSSDYREYFEQMSETETCQMYVCEDEIPFYLGILDDVVQIGVDETGDPRALLEAANDGVRDWAERRLDEFRGQAASVASE